MCPTRAQLKGRKKVAFLQPGLKKLLPRVLVFRHFLLSSAGGPGLKIGPEGWTQDSFQQGPVCDKQVPQEGINPVKVQRTGPDKVQT
jgi:hypothetical protein